MRKLTVTAALLLCLQNIFAQQLHFTSQYLQHNSMYNPAAAGIANGKMVGVSYRSMWSSFPGNPKTFMVYGDAELKKLKAGIGTYIYRDETGPTTRTGIQLAYSKHIISMGGTNKLGLGIELRGLQFAVDKAKLADALGSDPVLAGSSNKTAIDAGAGVYFTNDRLSVGAAVSQLIQSKLTLNSNVPNATKRANLYRHMVFTANYKIPTGENITLIPNAMARVIANSPSEFDFGCKLDYQDKIWTSLTWRVHQFWSATVGVKLLKQVNLAYSYDYYEAPLNQFNAGYNASELGLRFDFNK